MTINEAMKELSALEAMRGTGGQSYITQEQYEERKREILLDAGFRVPVSDWKTFTSHGTQLSPETVELLDKLWVPVPERCSDGVKKLLPEMHADVASMVGKEYKMTLSWLDKNPAI